MKIEKPYGTLCDYKTGNSMRPATETEWRASREAEAGNIGGGTGVIEVDGRSVYVEGGPEHSEPTLENQLWHARRLLADKGLVALENPHAATGRICGCGSCFCCAALVVVSEAKAGKAGAR